MVLGKNWSHASTDEREGKYSKPGQFLSDHANVNYNSTPYISTSLTIKDQLNMEQERKVCTVLLNIERIRQSKPCCESCKKQTSGLCKFLF